RFRVWRHGVSCRCRFGVSRVSMIPHTSPRVHPTAPHARLLCPLSAGLLAVVGRRPARVARVGELHEIFPTSVIAGVTCEVRHAGTEITDAFD
ncbi:hypothetical protein, partial [Nocardia seriolae]|uniref:hypothetical protein n=1 Tax=Nocardia seriolae TaxID=37332 RepID=UPI001E534ADB